MSLNDKVRCAVQGRPERCESCGAEFTCGPLWNCWCMREKVPRAVLAELEGKYERCLCPDCLRQAAQTATSANE